MKIGFLRSWRRTRPTCGNRCGACHAFGKWVRFSKKWSQQGCEFWLWRTGIPWSTGERQGILNRKKAWNPFFFFAARFSAAVVLLRAVHSDGRLQYTSIRVDLALKLKASLKTPIRSYKSINLSTFCLVMEAIFALKKKQYKHIFQKRMFIG